MQLGEIALRLGLPKSGVHRLLGALIEQGWVADAQGARGGLMYQPLMTSSTVPLHASFPSCRRCARVRSRPSASPWQLDAQAQAASGMCRPPAQLGLQHGQR
jgi:hypothetical protein